MIGLEGCALQNRYALTKLFLNTWVISDSPNPSDTSEWDVWDKCSRTTSYSSLSSSFTQFRPADQALTNDNLLSSNDFGGMASLTSGPSSSMRGLGSLSSYRSRSWSEASAPFSNPSSLSPSTTPMGGSCNRLAPNNKRQRTSSFSETPVHQFSAGLSLLNSATSPKSGIDKRRSSVANSNIARQTTK